MWKKFWFPPLEAAGFRFHFLLRERTDLRVLGDHGAAGGVRSPPRAAGGLGFPPFGKPALLGPGTLQFLNAISGARPPPGNAGQGCKRIPGEAGGGPDDQGSAWTQPTGGETRRGAITEPWRARSGPEPGRGHVGIASDGLRVRKCRLGQTVRGEVGAPIGRQERFPAYSPSHTKHEAFLPGQRMTRAVQCLGKPTNLCS